MLPKSNPTHSELRAEIRGFIARHPGDSLEATIQYWRNMHGWGWCGKHVTLAEIEQMVREFKAGA